MYKYDEAGRLTHIEAPAFMVYARTSGTSVQRTPTTDRTYDKAGNLVMEVEPDTGVVLNYYDALNRKVASVDADNALHEYEYDRAGNLVRERTYDTRLATPQSWQTLPTALNPGNYREMRYTYNANNLRTRTETPVERLYSYDLVLSNGRGYTDASVVTTTEYNANGDVDKVTDASTKRYLQFSYWGGNYPDTLSQVTYYNSATGTAVAELTGRRSR